MSGSPRSNGYATNSENASVAGACRCVRARSTTPTTVPLATVRARDTYSAIHPAQLGPAINPGGAPVKLALFDLDNTLVDRGGAFRRSVEQLQYDLSIDSPDFVPFVVEADQDGIAGWPAWMRAAQERFRFDGDIDLLVEQHQDRYSADIGGAAGVGINSIWIARGRRWVEDRFQPTEAVDTIAEAFDCLLKRPD